MKPMVALIISLLSGSRKPDFPNKKALIAEILSLLRYLGDRTYFIQKGLSLECKTCTMKKKVNSRLDTVTTTAQKIHKILEIVFKLALFQITKSNSKTCKKFNS